MDDGRFESEGQLATATESWAELRPAYALLDSLSRRERTVLVLRHLEGLTFAEIARFLEVSLATAKRLLKRASQSVAALST